MSSIEVGQIVPDFTLQAGGGKRVSLKQFRGRKVVIYFYPKDMTPTCTEESCHFRDYNDQFRQLNVEVIGISPDDPKSHEKFAAKHELPFLLLSDPDHAVCEQFGVWTLKKMYGKEYMGVERSTFLIDEEGRLVKEWRKVKVKGHVEQVLEAVKAL
ncbi:MULTISPECIES: thioredoxin-dependent thiol peroxidase [Paenibacillus]|uniref:thioredoxin-dependent peroxiredoxin n=1 Tax=Paenibacillus naphthalenovorans TaxID=162209 RepID=A0A0U2M7M5_9BACL|nr:MULTISPECIES: thioredoxin-dependent thiol peroxidase [Paenibacillus]ALS24192.1 peroxiredoxin [Paenibacillus naphthalenovorans]SDJ79828.1 peroxiredoxin Q/BCP [Paenibacillus naphthalenovorans]